MFFRKIFGIWPAHQVIRFGGTFHYVITTQIMTLEVSVNFSNAFSSTPEHKSENYAWPDNAPSFTPFR